MGHSEATAAEDQPQGCRTGRESKGAGAEGKGMRSVLPGTKALEGEQSQSWGAAWKERWERGRTRCSSSHSNKSFTAA